MSANEIQIRILIDHENNSESWWDAAKASEVIPDCIKTLIKGAPYSVKVTKSDGAKALEWAKSLPGWDEGPEYAKHPLFFVDLKNGAIVRS